MVPVLARLILASAVFAQNIALVAPSPTRARTSSGDYISWKEHLIDDQQIGGAPIRGGDGLQLADFDKDGFLDIVSVHEDSDHVRLAFGSKDPDKWFLTSLASGKEAAAAEDAAVGDVNGDGYPDILVACELAHLIYFQNPGKNARTARWPRVILENTRNRGSYIRAFLADLDQDGRLEALSPNKGEQLPTNIPGEPLPNNARFQRPISWFAIPSNPLDGKGWKEHELIRFVLPLNCPPIDLDGDGDLDIVACSRGEARMVILENRSRRPLEFAQHPVQIEGIAKGAPGPWGFMLAFHDFNRDGRLDLVLAGAKSSILWLEAPATFSGVWKPHRVGHIFPDNPTAMTVADLNGDGRMDIITGGYSQEPRDHDGPAITADHVVGRITWFENKGNDQWERHDVSRTKRGMYDAFVPRDMDGDGDLDLIGTRGNSGNFDGVFWLEQIRSRQPRPALTRARTLDSADLPLPTRQP